MKRIPIVNKYNINQYNNYLDDIDRPFIEVSHLSKDYKTEIEDFKIFFDHIEFARPTVFMEYCYNKNFPIYLRKLCDLAASAKKNWRDGRIMAAIEIMATNILDNLPKYLRVFDDDKLCVQNYEQKVYTDHTSFAITSGFTSDKVLNEPIDYLAFVSTQMENKLYPLPLNFVIYHNGDIIFNQLSVQFSTKDGNIKQFDRLLDINKVLREYLIPRAKTLKDLYNEKYMNTWIRETVDVIMPLMDGFFISKKESEDGKE